MAIEAPGLDHRRGGAGDRGLLHRGASRDLTWKPGSSALLPPTEVAPPWTLRTSPFSASASMSRRTVMSETPRTLDQLGDARPPVAVDLVQDPLLTLTCKHGQLPRRRSRQQIAALDPTHSNTMHRLGHARGGGRAVRRLHGGSAAAGHARRPRPARGGATRGATSVADLTQWRACPRTTTPPPRPSRASCPACSRRATRCTSATTSARWSTGWGCRRPRRVLLRRRPARADRRAPTREVLRERTRVTAAQFIAGGVDPERSALFVQSHIARARRARLGARAASPASARRAG